MKPLVSAMLLSACACLSGCAAGGLQDFVLEGRELAETLTTQRDLVAVRRSLPNGVDVNPLFSTEDRMIASIGRASSQGGSPVAGVRAVLYGYYREQAGLQPGKDVILYGLEAETADVAARLDRHLHGIWDYGAELGRVRVHRGGRVFFVVWHGGVSDACWQQINATLHDRLVQLGWKGAGNGRRSQPAAGG